MANRSQQALLNGFFRLYPDEAALELDHLDPNVEVDLIVSQAEDSVTRILPFLDPDSAVQVLLRLDGDQLRNTLTALDPGVTAPLLARLDSVQREDRLSRLPSGLRREIEILITYPMDSAGGMMDPRVTVFRSNESVAQALDRIRAVQRPITDLCVVDSTGKLTAVIPLRVAAVSSPVSLLENLIEGSPVSVQATAPRDEVVDLLESRKLLSLPVVSFEGLLLGTIRYDALVNAARSDATESLQAMAGAGREERALSTPWFAIRKRLPWLQVNLATAFLASAVVAMFEGTIAKYTMLAIFLPVVAGQSGNTGAQSLAVTMRGLALREISTRHWFRVSRKELLTGLANGVAVAVTTAGAAYLWTGSIGIPLVIAISMVFSMGMAGLAGAMIPVVLTLLRQDPAQSASIILTTVTDVVGFMSFLGLATILSERFGLVL